MSTIHIQLQKLHPAQAKIDHELKRFNVMACGRRFGKDVYEMNKTLEAAVEGYWVGFGAAQLRRDIPRVTNILWGIMQTEKL